MSDTELLPKPKVGIEAEPVRRIEVFTGTGRRRRWTPEQKALIVAETYDYSARACRSCCAHCAEGLAALVGGVLGEDPFLGTIFVFRCKRADRVKILTWDGSGLVLFWKRLEHGAFRWPPICDGTMRLSASQLAALIDGLDWSRLQARDVARPQAIA